MDVLNIIVIAASFVAGLLIILSSVIGIALCIKGVLKRSELWKYCVFTLVGVIFIIMGFTGALT